ncbi:MAG: hypothetical protein J1D77_06515 [Muribaculaceae bacterium]|nr:hypothetical protein [Muribaculaceae bacterium]
MTEITETKLSPFGAILQVMFNPVEGWKKLRRSGMNSERLQAGCFYPLLALLAVSQFAEFFYSVDVSFIRVFTEAVISFVAFFFSFFCIRMGLSWVLPKKMWEKFEEGFGKEYLIVALSTLAMFAFLKNILPMLWPVLFFLPLWTMYIMYKGVRFFKFEPNEDMKFYIFTVAGVIGMPILIEWGMTELIPM